MTFAKQAVFSENNTIDSALTSLAIYVSVGGKRPGMKSAGERGDDMNHYLEQGNFLYVMAAICLIGVVSKLAANHFYRGLIRQCENLGAARDRQLLQMKLKYESVYRSKNGVKNIQAFINRMIQQYRVGGLHLSSWESGAFYAGIVSFLTGALCALVLYQMQSAPSVSILYLAAGSLMAAGMITFSGMMDGGSCREALEAALLHYFENVLVVRGTRELPEAMDESELFQQESEEAAGAEGKGAAGNAYAASGARAKRSLRDDIFMRKETKEEENRGEKQLEELKESLAQLAAARSDGGQRQNHRQSARKLTPKEEQLINEIIQQYLS